MKKLFVIFAALALVASAIPAMAATDWDFYGSARMATWYQDGEAPALYNAHDNGNMNESDSELTWTLQGNSRIGAKVKHGTVSGYFEYGTGINLRKLYATWKPENASWSLLVGQTYTPLNIFYSGQVYGVDEGQLSTGQAYNGRHGMIQFAIDGFKIALVNITKASNLGAMFRSDPNSPELDAPGDVDVYLPKIEAAYHYGADQFFFDVVAGYQTWTVENPNGFGTDFTVDSWVFGGGGGVNFGPAYIKGAAYYGQNIGNYGIWTNASGYFGGVTLKDNAYTGLLASDAASAIVTYNQDAAGGLSYDTEDTNSLSFIGVVGFKVNDMVSLEAGGSYITYDNDLFVDNATVYSFYAQAPLTLAKGVFIVPEAGYYKIDQLTSGQDGESFWYFGAKWQINF